jgi:hypothetical protein
MGVRVLKTAWLLWLGRLPGLSFGSKMAKYLTLARLQRQMFDDESF